MHAKHFVPLMAVSAALLSGCATKPSATAVSSEPAAAVVPTETEQSLILALNAERAKAGRPALSVSSALSGFARQGSATAAASAGTTSEDVSRILARSNFTALTKYQGVLKDRGPRTGASFVDYWVKDQPGEVSGDWSDVGVGISKSADGRLFAVILLARSGGGSLMSPAMNPGGF